MPFDLEVLLRHGDPVSKLEMAHGERADLLVLLRTLSPEQWETPSLCAGWRVRDVVAHMISYDHLTLGGALSQLARGRFSLSRTNELGVARYAGRSTEDLVATFARYVRPRGLTAAFGGMVAFLDALIHHQDIRRTLDLPREVPVDRLRQALHLARQAPPLRARQRTRGLRLVATDVDFAVGTGPEVRGPGEALLMAMAGRRGAVDELTGPGQPVLAVRRAG